MTAKVQLEHEDLDIHPEHTTVLIAPNGCGKSPLPRLPAALIWPDGGQVLFHGAALS